MLYIGQEFREPKLRVSELSEGVEPVGRGGVRLTPLYVGVRVFWVRRPPKKVTLQGMKRQAWRLMAVYRSIEPVFAVAAGAGGSVQSSTLVFTPIIEDTEEPVNSELANL